MTLDEIAEALAINPVDARRALEGLRRSHRLERAESRFRISARIVEEFGQRFVASPRPESTKLMPQTLATLLAGESDTCEYKASLRWDLQTKQINAELEKAVAKTVSGFLNSAGGFLLIGVADDGTVLGIEDDLNTFGGRKNQDGFHQKLCQVLNNALGAEFCQYYHISFEQWEGKTICIVRVEKSPQPVYLTHKGTKEFYVRDGNTTKPLDVEAAHRYISMHWEAG